MLVDKTDGKLDEVKKFAKENGKLEQLESMLERLGNFRGRCLLFTDFAPMSFAFTVQVEKNGEWEYLFNGGLIYHGSHDGGGSGAAPTYSVCVSPVDGWSIHT